MPESLVADEWSVWTALDGFWQAGGPVMYVLLIIGIAMAAIALERSWFLFGLPARRWRRELRQVFCHDPDPVWHAAALAYGTVNLRLLRTLVQLAPLVGLLGTVSGMLVTFANLGTAGASAGLAHADGGVARGIGQAMITTQVGLLLALPGLLAVRLLTRRAEALVARASAQAFRHRSTVTLRVVDNVGVS